MKVLVTYTSKHGSTAEIAGAIARRLAARGLEVDVVPIAGLATVVGYDGAVIGSAVYVGSWMKEASAFVKRSTEALSTIPVWLFSSGPIDDSDEHALSDRQLAELEAGANPREHRVFGGVVDLSKLGFVEKRIVKMVKASETDRRDWRAIDAFADAIADALSARAG